ncbi:hypothetical protein [Photobacterium swingsii]|uniref:hypothetical protein n=1 Tax=Photobacterium swingsii TaxID=680026 RepID=UPI0040687ED2
MTILRSKWYKLRADLSLVDIASKLNVHQYKQDDPFGFDVINNSDKSITIRYSERYFHTESFLNVYGDVVIDESVRYKVVTFNMIPISDGFFLIHMENTPRSSLELFSNFETVIESAISVSTVLFNVMNLLEMIRERSDVRQFKIKKAVFSGITLTPKSRAKIEVTSTGDALIDFNKKHKSEAFIIDKLNCHFRLDSKDLTLELRKTGVISHSKQLTSILNVEMLTLIKNREGIFNTGNIVSL